MQQISPSAVPTLKFASMGGWAWNTSALSGNDLLVSIAAHWAKRGVEVLSDQHMNDPSFNATAAAAASYVAMQADLRRRGSPLRMFIGEEDCAEDKRLPNDGYCHSHTRALSHALLTATTARLGSDFIVGQAPCDQFGASGLQEVWPQAQVEFNNRGVLEQPPALANRMIAQQYMRFNDSSLHVLDVSPSSFTDDSDNNQILDLLFLTAPTRTLMLRAVNTRQAAASVEVSISGDAAHCEKAAQSPPLKCIVLACAERAVNCWTAPDACSPKPLPTVPTFAAGQLEELYEDTQLRSCGTMKLSVPPLSFTVCHASAPSR